ncbi:F420-dependent biliverdin reductase [Kineosporia mesophila]|uniref:F420-dependent biliverdin reductase n=1 Tax=Kineosporia mesophila TaxID=566012 RepID=A0ABP6Z3S4_9ACTN
MCTPPSIGIEDPWHPCPVAFDPADLPASARPLLTERHLATLTTLRADGSPHVVPVGFTWDAPARRVRVICSGDSVKARNAARGTRAAVSVVDGRFWLTLEGPAHLLEDEAEVREGERRYAERYREPRENPSRVVLAIQVDRVLGNLPKE